MKERIVESVENIIFEIRKPVDEWSISHWFAIVIFGILALVFVISRVVIWVKCYRNSFATARKTHWFFDSFKGTQVIEKIELAKAQRFLFKKAKFFLIPTGIYGFLVLIGFVFTLIGNNSGALKGLSDVICFISANALYILFPVMMTLIAIILVNLISIYCVPATLVWSIYFIFSDIAWKNSVMRFFFHNTYELPPNVLYILKMAGLFLLIPVAFYLSIRLMVSVGKWIKWTYFAFRERFRHTFLFFNLKKDVW